MCRVLSRYTIFALETHWLFSQLRDFNVFFPSKSIHKHLGFAFINELFIYAEDISSSGLTLPLLAVKTEFRKFIDNKWRYCSTVKYPSASYSWPCIDFSKQRVLWKLPEKVVWSESFIIAFVLGSSTSVHHIFNKIS